MVLVLLLAIVLEGLVVQPLALHVLVVDDHPVDVQVQVHALQLVAVPVQAVRRSPLWSSAQLPFLVVVAVRELVDDQARLPNLVQF